MTPLRLLVNAIVGGSVLFAWSALAGIGLRLDDVGVADLPHEAQVVSALHEHVPDEGLYSFPGSGVGPAALAEKHERARTGPTGLLLVHPQGREYLGSRQLLVAYLGDCGAALLAGFFLWLAAPRVRTFAWRATFVAALGGFASLAAGLPSWNTYGFPASYALASAALNVLGFTLVGLFFAWRMKTSEAAFRSPPQRVSRP